MFLVKNKFLIIISVYFLGTVLLLRFAAMPYVAKLKSQADSIQERIIDNQIEGARFEEIPRMEEMYNNYQKNEDFVNVILDPNEQLSFIKSLEDLAEDTGNKISLKAEDPGSASQTARARRSDSKEGDKGGKDIMGSLPYDRYFPMEITLEGDYQGLANFVRKLENFNYYVNIISIDAKKTIQLPEEKTATTAANPSDSRNVFTPADSVPAVEEKKEIEVITSVIKVVVYNKK
ncbi:MAG: hypothetical protein QG620_744 [Patescibacteria group bacterium]|nr:hypothetical protein [Patescibacteria group bacterium]